ncbi:hypothetical protein WAI453_004692 [Rhynchosporium graminicola]
MSSKQQSHEDGPRSVRIPEPTSPVSALSPQVPPKTSLYPSELRHCSYPKGNTGDPSARAPAFRNSI